MSTKNKLKPLWQKLLNFCHEQSAYITAFFLITSLFAIFFGIDLFSQEHCVNCTQMISSTAIYCNHCGYQHLPTCSHCGEVLSETDAFCSHCGTPTPTMLSLKQP